MFERKYRLPSSVKVSGITHKTTYFTVKVAANNLSHNRYAFRISKKIDKRAVVRNRIRRRLSASLEKMHKKLTQGNDMIFILHKNSQEATVLQFSEVLQYVLD